MRGCIHQGSHLRSPWDCPSPAQPHKRSLLITRLLTRKESSSKSQSFGAKRVPALSSRRLTVTQSSSSPSRCPQPLSQADTRTPSQVTSQSYRKLWSSYHCEPIFPPRRVQQPRVLAGVPIPQPLEALEAEKGSCGANGSPLIVFLSLSCWPRCLGNQPNPARGERAAAYNFRIFPRICS